MCVSIYLSVFIYQWYVIYWKYCGAPPCFPVVPPFNIPCSVSDKEYQLMGNNKWNLGKTLTWLLKEPIITPQHSRGLSSACRLWLIQFLYQLFVDSCMACKFSPIRWKLCCLILMVTLSSKYSPKFKLLFSTRGCLVCCVDLCDNIGGNQNWENTKNHNQNGLQPCQINTQGKTGKDEAVKSNRWCDWSIHSSARNREN